MIDEVMRKVDMLRSATEEALCGSGSWDKVGPSLEGLR